MYKNCCLENVHRVLLPFIVNCSKKTICKVLYILCCEHFSLRTIKLTSCLQNINTKKQSSYGIFVKHFSLSAFAQSQTRSMEFKISYVFTMLSGKKTPKMSIHASIHQQQILAHIIIFWRLYVFTFALHFCYFLYFTLIFFLRSSIQFSTNQCSFILNFHNLHQIWKKYINYNNN